METPSSRILKELHMYTEEEWNALYKRLMYFAYRRYGWVPYVTMDSVSVEDLIHEAIISVIEGKRVWPKDVELFKFLCEVIRSKASHILERKGRIVTIEGEELWSDTVASSVTRQEEAPREAEYQQFCNKIRELVCDDEVLTRIMEALFVEPDMKPRDIAEWLGLPIEEVRNAQKRLKRNLKNLEEKGINTKDE
jgi:RNA polymerase sigma factor (sigma-70 family)